MAVCFHIRYELEYAHVCPVWLVKGNDIINHRKSRSSGEVKTSSKISDTVHGQLRDCCIKLTILYKRGPQQRSRNSDSLWYVSGFEPQ